MGGGEITLKNRGKKIENCAEERKNHGSVVHIVLKNRINQFFCSDLTKNY